MRILNMRNCANNGEELIISIFDNLELGMYWCNNGYLMESTKYPLRKELFSKGLHRDYHFKKTNYYYCFTYDSSQLELCAISFGKSITDRLIEEAKAHGTPNFKLELKSTLNQGFPDYSESTLKPFTPTDSEKPIMQKLWTNRASLKDIIKFPKWYENDSLVDELVEKGISCEKILIDRRNKKIDTVLDEKVVEKN